MPRFSEYQDVEVDVNIDISVDQFLTECDVEDIKEIIKALREDGFLKDTDLLDEDQTGGGDWEYTEAIAKLAKNYHQLPNVDTDYIIQLAKRF